MERKETTAGNSGAQKQTEQIYAALYKLTLGLEAVQTKLNALNRTLEAHVFNGTQTDNQEGST